MATYSANNEYLAWDNVETVYVTRYKDGEEQPRVTLDYALRIRPNDKRSSFNSVRVSARETTYWLPVAEFGTKEPDGNMRLERASNGEKYRLLESNLVSYGTSDSHWDCLFSREQDEP